MIDLPASRAAEPQLPRVPAVDLATLEPGDFADDELDLPYLLAHFHRVANAVVSEGEHRGFIDLPVWRRPEHNAPHNARVLENHVALAFFYCTDRPWNPYRGHPAVRARLEALLAYWLSLQNEQGLFPEYSPDNYSLAPTGFGLMMMAQTLRLLHDGPPIDRALHERVIEATRRSIRAVLTLEAMYEHGKRFSNQFTGMYGAAQGFLRLYPDEEVGALLKRRMESAVDDFRSPAGFPYERDGCDWAYTLDTHHMNTANAWRFARGTELAAPLLAAERKWVEWLSYNAVREPDGSYFTLNRAIESRQSQTGFYRWSTPLAEEIPLARAFAATDQEHRRQIASRRKALEQRWPAVEPLTTYSPHAFVMREDPQWYPSDAQRSAATKNLPYLARERFTHQRTDDRAPATFTFIRRPAYYAAFTSGRPVMEQQRYGLGLLWHPQMGTVLQSQSRSNDAAWGTIIGDNLVEAAGFTPSFVGHDDPPPGVRDLGGDQNLLIRWPLPANGSKSISFADGSIDVLVEHEGTIVEQIPLLLREKDRIEQKAGNVILRRGGNSLWILCGEATVHVTEPQPLHGPWRVAVVRLSGEDALKYTFRFDRAE